MLGPGKLDISKWVPKSTMLGPKIDDFCYIFWYIFVDFMFNFVSWPGRPDKRRTHTEHTQSTHTEHTQSPREATKPERAEVVVRGVWELAEGFWGLTWGPNHMRIHMRTHMTIHMRTHMRAHMSTDDGDEQCIRISFFLKSWCYFSSSAVALLVGISKFKHIYEAELQLSTRFPFHCQDRFLLRFKWGSEH